MKKTNNNVQFCSQTENILEKIENELMENSASHEGEVWILGPTFSAVDIMLTVILNRLALLGFGDRFWGQRPGLQRFMDQVQSRDSFARSVTRIGFSQASGGGASNDTGRNLNSPI